MDGYVLICVICEMFVLCGFKVVLYSLISGMFNEVMVKEVVVDCFIVKF